MLFVVMMMVMTMGPSGAMSQQCSSLSNCPVCEPPLLEVDLLAPMVASLQPSSLALLANVRKALSILRTMGSVVSDDEWDLHSTTQYLCCYSLDNVTHSIFPALDKIHWSPFNVSILQLVCNFDNATSHGAHNTTSLILRLAPSSQAAMAALVAQFEQAIAATGLPVVPRSSMEFFHITLAVVAPEFPVAQALQKINDSITDWTDGLGPIVVSEFASVFPPKLFKATSSSSPSLSSSF